ncbi:hypothetical protein SCB29_35960, partial [Paraburkholderia sp. SIMBA_055]
SVITSCAAFDVSRISVFLKSMGTPSPSSIMRRPVSIRYIAGCIALGCFVHVAAAETVAYSVTDLGALTDGAATGINERGDIVGDSFASRDMTDL